MSRALWIRALVCTACLVLLLGVRSTADDAADALAGPHALDDGIRAAQSALEEGDGKQGLAQFLALLEAHRGKDYAKGRRAEIAALIRRLACASHHKLPRAKDLLSGELQGWSGDSGKIRIRFTPTTAKDFEDRDGMLCLPARLTGPFTFEVKGSALPADAKDAPRVHLGGDQHPDSGRVQGWEAQFGASATLTHLDGDDRHPAGKKDRLSAKAGKAWKLLLKGTETRLTAQWGSTTVGAAPKHAEVWGYLAFRAPGWTEAKLTGSIDPFWIESRVDEVCETQLEEFDKTYDPGQVVPKWLDEPLARETAGPKGREVDLLGRLDDRFYDAMQGIYNDLRNDEFDSAWAAIAAIQADGAPEATCEYLRAEARRRMTRLDDALVHLARCIALEPAFLEGVLLQGSLLRELGRFDEALAAFERATAGHAQFPRAYEEAAQAMLFAGRAADAKRLTQLAARNGVTSKTLVTLNGALAKAVDGPRWRRRFEHRSRNYHVVSNMDHKTCAEAAILLEEAFEAYRGKLGWVPRDATRLFQVYLFSDQAGFMGYQADLEEFMGKPTEKAAGLYSPLLKQLLIWNLPDRADMLDTIRHEGFHQYLDRLMPNPPVWFNEGLAVYHENGMKVDGKLTFGHLHPQYVSLLQQKGLIPLEKFLYGGSTQFYEDGHRSYGQGWALVHMLQHTTPAYRALFDGLVKDLQTQSSFVVLKRAFPADALARIETDLRDYVFQLAGEK